MRIPRGAIGRHWPVLMLGVATVCWGMGFSWAKNVGDAINHAAGQPPTAAVGPLLGLTLRFSIASVLWALFSPAARRGWTWQTVRRSVTVGSMLSLGLVLQHLGLGLTDEATTAFLTNLAVVFVPAWVLAVSRQPPRRELLIAVAIALPGIILLSGVGHAGSIAGALFGIACAAAFAAEILLLDHAGRRESAARLTLGLFVTTALVCGVLAVLAPGFVDIRWRTLGSHAFLVELVPLVAFTTLLAFALMTLYQPKVDPVRAVVLYLAEPLFAAAYAWMHNGRGMTGAAIGGACLILLANAVAEWKRPRV